MHFDYALFDLDGTLTASAPGITKSVQYALHCQGIEEPDIEKLNVFVGPPLASSFEKYYGFDADRIRQAVEDFRSRYETIGIFENSLYPGTREMLQKCRAGGILLGVASSKPEVHVKTVLAHFGVETYFDIVCGSDYSREQDGKVRPSDKDRIVKRALDHFLSEDGDRATFRARTAMVGDRCFDMEGAKANGVYAVGVSFGYGSRDELLSSGACCIAGSMEELGSFLTGGAAWARGQRSAVRRS
ncbi:MAG: HAD hydrolase-like protein [Lachnospiraceae bacterium]|jgi:phosphoglycolate phosphatase|nr:HAD hydrolase-like protein [Lachnospiraceae bacterium]